MLEDGEVGRVAFLVSGQAELGEDGRDVLLDAALAELELAADRLVRAALGDQREHLALARAERRQRAVVDGARQQLGDHLGVERGAARDHAPQHAGELLDVADAVLEQVPEPLRALRQQPCRGPGLDVLGAMTIPIWGWRARMSLRRAQPLVGECRRHPDVDDRHVGLVLVDQPQQLVGRRCLRGHVESGAPEQGRDPLAHQRAVVGDHDAHGSSAVITVPAPGGLVTSSRPFQRLHSVGQAVQARAVAGVGAADAVVGDLDRHACRGPRQAHRCRRRLGVLADVGQRLAGHEVHGEFDRPGHVRRRVARHRRGHRRTRRPAIGAPKSSP